MLQIKNTTPFVADVNLFPNPQGVDTLYPVIKATFNVVDGRITIADQQMNLVKSDQYFGDPSSSSIKQIGDYHPAKPCSDVFVFGDCIIADGAAAVSCDVDVEIGTLKKSLRVFGDRYWDRGRISTPEMFDHLPLVYERAFGGVVRSEANLVEVPYPANPAGLGFAGGRDIEQMNDQPLPNIEDPSCLIEHTTDEPIPAGFAPIAPFWSSRSEHAGSYDERWQVERAPFLPLDFNEKFFQCASKGLIYDGFLNGNEPVMVSNMRHQGLWCFTLPDASIECLVKWRNDLINVPLNLESVSLYPNSSSLVMVWRGALKVNQWALQVDEIQFSLVTLQQ